VKKVKNFNSIPQFYFYFEKIDYYFNISNNFVHQIYFFYFLEFLISILLELMESFNFEQIKNKNYKIK